MFAVCDALARLIELNGLIESNLAWTRLHCYKTGADGRRHRLSPKQARTETNYSINVLNPINSIRSQFANESLVLLGHGTVLNAESAAPVYQHAAALRERGLFAGVHEAFWKQEPRIDTVLRSLTTPRVFIVPLFIREGYFGGEMSPCELGCPKSAESAGARIIQRGAQTWFYCKPVGTHPLMTELLLKRAREVVERFPFPRSEERRVGKE